MHYLPGILLVAGAIAAPTSTDTKHPAKLFGRQAQTSCSTEYVNVNSVEQCWRQLNIDRADEWCSAGKELREICNELAPGDAYRARITIRSVCGNEERSLCKDVATAVLHIRAQCALLGDTYASGTWPAEGNGCLEVRVQS